MRVPTLRLPLSYRRAGSPRWDSTPGPAPSTPGLLMLDRDPLCEVEAVIGHDLVPRGHEVTDEGVFSVVSGVELGDSPQLGV